MYLLVVKRGRKHVPISNESTLVQNARRIEEIVNKNIMNSACTAPRMLLICLYKIMLALEDILR